MESIMGDEGILARADQFFKNLPLDDKELSQLIKGVEEEIETIKSTPGKRELLLELNTLLMIRAKRRSH